MENNEYTNIVWTDVLKRLKKSISYLKGSEQIRTHQDIVNAMKINKSTMSSAVNGDERYLTENFIKNYASTYTSISEDWLLFGKGEMLITSKPNLPNTVTPVPEEDYMMVEYVDLATNAGTLGGGIVNNLDERKTRLVPREYDKGYYLVVRVSGDSMDDGTSRSLKDGDEILIRQWQENIQYLPIKKKLFVINTNEGSVIKQITEINYKEKYITLHSFNEEYRDYDVYFDDILQIFAVEKIVNSKIEF